MLIIVPKCILSFSIQVFLNDVHYHKYHRYHHRWQNPCKSVSMATRQNDLFCAILKSDWRPIFSGARSFSTLLVQIVLGRPFGLFHPAAVSLLLPAKLSDNHPLGKLLQRDRINITGLNERCRQTKKNIGLESHLLMQIVVPLKFSTFFKNASKFQLRNMHFNITKYSWFLEILIVKFSLYIYIYIYIYGMYNS